MKIKSFENLTDILCVPVLSTFGPSTDIER